MEVRIIMTDYMSGVTLQWGHDKIVMEVKQTKRGKNMVYRLQWGHDKIVMEV